MCRKNKTAGKVFQKLATSHYLHVQDRSPQSREELPGTEFSTAVLIFPFSMDYSTVAEAIVGMMLLHIPRIMLSSACSLVLAYVHNCLSWIPSVSVN